MAEGPYDIKVSQRATYAEVFAFREDDEVTVIPLTGATAVGQVRLRAGHPDILATFTIAINQTAGELALGLTATQTAALPAGNLQYDVLLTMNGATTVFLEGKVKVDPTVTVPA